MVVRLSDTVNSNSGCQRELLFSGNDLSSVVPLGVFRPRSTRRFIILSSCSEQEALEFTVEVKVFLEESTAAL